MLLESVLPKHPVTGCTAIGIGKRGPIWLAAGAEDNGDAAAQAAAAAAALAASDAAKNDKGFPADTPLTEMTDAQQAAYWKHQARKHETAVKSKGDYDDLKSKAAQYDALLASTQSDQEKAIEEAKKQARQDAAAEATPRIVRAEFKAAAKGVLTTEQTNSLLEDLDLSKYVTAAGDVDEEKITKKIAAFAPAKGDGKKNFPDLGQGRQAGDTKLTGREKGLAEAQRRGFVAAS